MNATRTSDQSASIEGPLTASGGLFELRPLWIELHRHHRRVSDYRPLVGDLDASWSRRLALYQSILRDDGFYFVARAQDASALGYAFCAVAAGQDDTFVVRGGIVELVTLVVTAEARGRGIGTRLIETAEAVTADRGMDTMKIAVMSGNEGARRLYTNAGYRTAEEVLYRRLAAKRAEP